MAPRKVPLCKQRRQKWERDNRTTIRNYNVPIVVDAKANAPDNLTSPNLGIELNNVILRDPRTKQTMAQRLSATCSKKKSEQRTLVKKGKELFVDLWDVQEEKSGVWSQRHRRKKNGSGDEDVQGQNVSRGGRGGASVGRGGASRGRGGAPAGRGATGRGRGGGPAGRGGASRGRGGAPAGRGATGRGMGGSRGAGQGGGRGGGRGGRGGNGTDDHSQETEPYGAHSTHIGIWGNSGYTHGWSSAHEAARPASNAFVEWTWLYHRSIMQPMHKYFAADIKAKLERRTAGLNVLSKHMGKDHVKGFRECSKNWWTSIAAIRRYTTHWHVDKLDVIPSFLWNFGADVQLQIEGTGYSLLVRSGDVVIFNSSLRHRVLPIREMVCDKEGDPDWAEAQDRWALSLFLRTQQEELSADNPPGWLRIMKGDIPIPPARGKRKAKLPPEEKRKRARLQKQQRKARQAALEPHPHHGTRSQAPPVTHRLPAPHPRRERAQPLRSTRRVEGEALLDRVAVIVPAIPASVPVQSGRLRRDAQRQNPRELLHDDSDEEGDQGDEDEDDDYEGLDRDTHESGSAEPSDEERAVSEQVPRRSLRPIPRRMRTRSAGAS